jgi:hypothetical protein
MLKAVNQLFDTLLLLNEQMGYNNNYYAGYISYYRINDDPGLLDT